MMEIPEVSVIKLPCQYNNYWGLRFDWKKDEKSIKAEEFRTRCKDPKLFRMRMKLLRSRNVAF